MIKFNQVNLNQFYQVNNLVKVKEMGFKNRGKKETITELIIEIDKTKLKRLTDKFNSIFNRLYINKPVIENSFTKLFK